MIRSTQGSTSTRVPILRGKKALLGIVAGIFLAAYSPVPAHANSVPAGAATPREGNTYDHKDHQPTEADISGAVQPPSAVTTEVNKEVQDLLGQANRLDKDSEERLELH